MTSAYLSLPRRSYEQALIDTQHHGDRLEYGRKRALDRAAFLREQVAFMRHSGYDAAWIRYARREHTRAVATRLEYEAAINEREIMRGLRLI